jgi:hypothetical protein
MCRNACIVTGGKHHTVADSFVKNCALHRVAINTVLRESAGSKKWKTEKNRAE